MKTVAIVPVKRLSEAKGRLADALTAQARVVLARHMLDHVLDTILRAARIDGVAVISPDETLPLPSGVELIRQKGSGLNKILEQGRAWSVEQTSDALLVVFADLPLLTSTELNEIVEAGSERNTIVIAPDRHGEGTNALLSHPPSLARFHFGPHSYTRHLQAATQANARAVTYTSPGTTFDIDTPRDLEEYGGRSAAC
jgi:2-phospho-L-lactate guanylyltransferase